MSLKAIIRLIWFIVIVMNLTKFCKIVKSVLLKVMVLTIESSIVLGKY